MCLITIFQNYVTVWVLEEHQFILYPQPEDCRLSLSWLLLKVFLCEDRQNESDTSCSLSLRTAVLPTWGLKLSASFPFLLTIVLWCKIPHALPTPALPSLFLLPCFFLFMIEEGCPSFQTSKPRPLAFLILLGYCSINYPS